MFKVLRFLSSGESHGPAVLSVLDSPPANLLIDPDFVKKELHRRKVGYGRGPRMKFETDEPVFLSGMRGNRTIGTPLTIVVFNKDHQNWKGIVEPFGWDETRAFQKAFFTPRPGHGDLAGYFKYGVSDLRDILERASARETTARVASGAIAKQFLERLGVKIYSHTVRIGTVALERRFGDYSIKEIKEAQNNEFRVIERALIEKFKAEIDKAREEKDTLGGTVEIVAAGVVPGLGSHVQWDRKLDARISAALMSIQSAKAVEIGAGTRASEFRGSQHHDPIVYEDSTIRRTSNNAGGIEAGISNGEEIIARIHFKPISTLLSPLPSVDIRSFKRSLAHVERSDICVVEAAGVVAEAMMALTLMDAYMEKFGGDDFNFIAETLENYKNHLKERGYDYERRWKEI